MQRNCLSSVGRQSNAICVWLRKMIIRTEIFFGFKKVELQITRKTQKVVTKPALLAWNIWIPIMRDNVNPDSILTQ